MIGKGLSVALLLLGLIVCTPEVCRSQENRAHSFELRIEAGVEVARSQGGPKYLGELFHYEPLFTLEQDPEVLASLVGRAQTSCKLGEDGSVYVRDMAPVRIVRFGPDGVYRNDIGRMGQGPGEYQNPILQSVANGAVTVFDPNLARTTVFRSDGSLIRTVSLPRLRRSLSFLAYIPLDDGGILIDRISKSVPEGSEQTARAVISYSSDGDTLWQLQTDMVKGDYLFDGGVHAWRVFEASPSARVHPHRGVYLTTGLEPVIDVYDFSGKLTKVIDSGIPPQRVSTEERMAVEQGLASMIDAWEAPEMKSRYRKLSQYVELQDPKAYWSGLTVDASGHIWALQPNYTFNFIVRDVLAYRNYRYRVFSPDGEYLGETKVPTRGSISRGHYIALEDNEESGGIDIVVYRILPAVDGLVYPN